MFRKITLYLLAAMLFAAPSFAHTHFGVVGTVVGKIGQYGRIAAHIEVPTNPGCMSQNNAGYVGSAGVQVFVRGVDPITRARYTNSIWDHLTVNRGGGARLLIVPGYTGIKCITYKWHDDRGPVYERYPTGSWDNELRTRVIAHDFHPRFYPEVLDITVEYVSALGDGRGEETLQYTFDSE